MKKRMWIIIRACLGITGCAVKEAVEKGKIHAVRYEDYKELYEELKNKRRY